MKIKTTWREIIGREKNREHQLVLKREYWRYYWSQGNYLLEELRSRSNKKKELYTETVSNRFSEINESSINFYDQTEDI